MFVFEKLDFMFWFNVLSQSNSQFSALRLLEWDALMIRKTSYKHKIQCLFLKNWTLFIDSMCWVGQILSSQQFSALRFLDWDALTSRKTSHIQRFDVCYWKLGLYLVTDTPQNGKLSISQLLSKSAIFLFSLLKVEVLRVLGSKKEEIPTVGSWGYLGLKMTLKIDFWYSSSTPGGATWNFYCGISRGY